MQDDIIQKIKSLLEAYKTGKLGDTTMPEDTHPDFANDLEFRRIFYTLPMALNYQRNSYKLWESAKKTAEDKSAANVFDIDWVSKTDTIKLQKALLKHKLALQPNKHTNTWLRLSKTINEKWGSVTKLFDDHNSDYLQIRETIQKRNKKDFPYLSGPKIFNYWCYIQSTYGKIKLKNREFIEIAPDTHVIQSSIKLGLISKDQSEKLSREEISNIWRNLLKGTGIDPIDMHSPLWFWSRSNFAFQIEN